MAGSRNGELWLWGPAVILRSGYGKKRLLWPAVIVDSG